ncbi:MAG: DUF177 domain-containing protein [Hyphomicrobiales bacterium]
MNHHPETGPLVVLIRASRIPPAGRTIEIDGTAAQCAAVAAGLDIIRVDSLAATVTLAPGEAGALEVCTRVRAAMRRRCVVTLEEFDTTFDETFQQLFFPQSGDGPAAGAEVVIDPEDPDDAATYANDEIDLGGVIYENLAVALDPHPRAPGAPEATDALKALDLGKNLAAKITAGPVQTAEKPPSPFAVLAHRGNGGKS